MTLQLEPSGEGHPLARSLSTVLLRKTLVIALALGVVASAVTMWVDLQREKNAVEDLAVNFMSSAAPSAAAAAYNYDQAAAEQVAKGLFLERSITGITILNEGDVMVDEVRNVPPTLPQIGLLGSVDEVVLSQALYEPGANQQGTPIGELAITIDRSLVAPEIVDRLFTFFFITTAKNVLFSLLLFWMIFNLLAVHISALARMTQLWQPGAPKVCLPHLPHFLKHTEVAALGNRIEELTLLANGALDSVKKSHDAVVDSNLELSDTVRDRTRELEYVNLRLQRMADHDSLTGLYNRAYFDRLMDDAFSMASHAKETLSILLIDVDYFKAFNDFYGHQAGDKVLVSLGEILKRIHERTGCILARYGGEEFVGVLKSDAATAKQVAKDIHAALESAAIEHHHSTVARRVTVSIGTASTAEEGCNANMDVLVSAADDALYEAKFSGRNRTIASTPEIRAKAQEQRLSVRALLDAIEAGEFEPYAQPQVDARTGELVGAEALVRWVRADGTVVPPASFMQTAEQTGLIKKIDAIVLEKLRSFLSTHPTALPRLSFNVTGESFASTEYFNAILELSTSSETGITVELLETAFIDRPNEHFLWQLDALRDAGVEIEIDDFGTGRTSILGLMSINPNRLKIARELISPLAAREGQLRLVTSVVEIAASLNMNVLAEGVETKETAQTLIDIGCPIQQGFFHGRPMPMHDLLKRHPQAKANIRNGA
ncbi:MAG: bifunctional diguanylate cyclase/phosphodiesterase [Pseudomonadota bacterium]